MQTSTKRTLKYIGKNDLFKEVMEKLSTNHEMTNKEKSFILSCGIAFFNEYKKDKRHLTYADISYYIFLKYSLQYKDYRPLFDFAVNFGFYPIVKTILKNDLLDSFSVENSLIDNKINKYRHGSGYIETFHQFEERNLFIDDASDQKSYIAPTSFGKSSVIAEYIENIPEYASKKIAIIVPTKSLLMQTYKSIRDSQINSNIIIHDDMHKDDMSFIAIFTQERALRLSNKEVLFDVLIIDEAHKIFEKGRGILLSRLLRKNYILNNDQKVIYLSPLVEDSNNLIINTGQQITSHEIHFNLKEPEFFEYQEKTKKVYQYNRFVDDFYNKDEEYENIFSYIKEKSQNKNFIFENNPHDIEKMSYKICNSGYFNLHQEDLELRKLKNILSDMEGTPIVHTPLDTHILTN